MSLRADLIATLDRALAEAVNPFTFLITDAPSDIADFFDAAIACADRHQVPILEVRLGAGEAALADERLRGVPVRIHRDESVVRFAFGRREDAPALAAGL